MEKKTKAKQGFQKWRFVAKVAILRRPVAPELCGDSPPKKWRFLALLENLSKSGDFKGILAIFKDSAMIFGLQSQ